MKNKTKANPYIINGLISLGIAVAGGIYISKLPSVEPKYAPIEVKTGKYNLVDVNNDKKVDVIKIDGIIKYVNESKEMDKIFEEIPNYKFLGFQHTKPITSEIQIAADSVFNGHLNEKNLEKSLLEGRK